MDLIHYLSDHTYRTITISVVLIAIVAGSVGTMTYLRGKILLSDVIAHSSLAGVYGAFIIGSILAPAAARDMSILIPGALIGGIAATLMCQFLDRYSPLTSSTGLAVTIATLFGTALLLLHHINLAPYPQKGGMSSYLLGNVAHLTQRDLQQILVVTCAVTAVLAIGFRHCSWVIVDPEHAAVRGVPVRLVQSVLNGCLVAGTVVGITAMGIVLMVSMLAMPAVGMRPWVRSIRALVFSACAMAAATACIGSFVSIVYSLPTGPVITLTLAASAGVSLLAASIRERLESRSHAHPPAYVCATAAKSDNPHTSERGAR